MPRKERIGTIVSNKMDKTIVVAIQDKQPHPMVGKVMSHRVKFKAHDELNEGQEGDKVLIQESRPYSKDKCWKLVKVLEKAQAV